MFATALIRAVNLVSIPIFSRLLSTGEYGKVDVFMTYVNIFTIILGLDFNGTVGKGRLDYGKDADAYQSSSILFTTCFTVFVFFVINILYNIFPNLLGFERVIANLILIYSYAMFVVIYKTAEYNFNYKYGKNMLMSFAVAMGNLSLSVIFILTFFSRQKFMGRVLGATIPTVLIGMLVYYELVKKGGLSIKGKYVKYSLQFGIPLIPHNLSHMVLSGADRIMINSIIGASEAGIYSLIYTLGMMLQVVSEAFNNVFGAWLFRQMQEKEDLLIKNAQRFYLLFYSMIAVAVMTISPEIIKVVGPKEYWAGIPVVMWVVFATFLNFTYTLYVNIEFFHRKTALISAGTIMAAICNVILNKMFLTRYGYQFGAISTVISYLALLIFHTIIVDYVLKIRIVDDMHVYIVVALIFFFTCVLTQFVSLSVVRLLLGLLCEIILACGVGLTLKRYGKPDIVFC